MWVLNLGKPVHIPVLNEAMAIELGANLLGETIVFTMAAVLVVLEYNRYNFALRNSKLFRYWIIGNLGLLIRKQPKKPHEKMKY